MAAAPDPVIRPPFESRLVAIAPLTLPAVSISSSGIPIILTRAGLNVSSVTVGFPAYAQVDAVNCNNGRAAGNPRNNICRDGNNNPKADAGKWLCADGRAWSAFCPTKPPLIDINGDGVPDNFSILGSTLATRVTLVGDGSPSRDMTNTGVYDMDMNGDGIVDMVFSNGFGGLQIMLGNDVTDQGNAAKATPVPDQGFSPSAMTDKSGQLAMMLPAVSVPGYFEVAVGAFYDAPLTYSINWSSVTAPNITGLTAEAFASRSAGSPMTAARVTGLDLPVPNITKLATALTPDATTFFVDDASKLNLPGIIYVGSEVLRAERLSSTLLRVTGQDLDPPPGTGRGLRGSAPIVHMAGEPVSDSAAIFFARYVPISGNPSAARAMAVFRVAPSAPVVDLSVSGANIAPVGAAQGQRNVPLLKIDLQTNLSTVLISRMRLTQQGTIISTTPAWSTRPAGATAIWAASASGSIRATGSSRPAPIPRTPTSFWAPALSPEARWSSTSRSRPILI